MTQFDNSFELPVDGKALDEEIFAESFNGTDSSNRNNIDEAEINITVQMRTALPSSDGFAVVSSWYRNPNVAARLPPDKVSIRYGDFGHLCCALEFSSKYQSRFSVFIGVSRNRYEP